MALPRIVLVQLVTLASFALLVALAFLWLRTYRETKSKFSLGLVLFASFLALQALVRLAIVAARDKGASPANLARLEFAGEIGELVALVILVYNVAR